MNQATPATRDLAYLLLMLEADQTQHAQDEAHIALSVFEILRVSLSQLVGIIGFQALLTRALALTKTDVGWLTAICVAADATLEGFCEAARQQPSEVVAEGSAALLGQFLGLLVTFIGQSLTLRLLQREWPKAQWDDRNQSAKEPS